MANSKTANTYNRQNWEDASFPILCETCMGPSPFVRMMKERYGKECKICSRPFTVFRWCPGPKARFKKTEICQTCAKVKNVCQTCIFDLEFGLPVEVRDKALRINQQLPRSDVNREFFHQQIEQQLDLSGDVTAPYGGHELIGKSLAGSNVAAHSAGTSSADMLLKLARTTPYYRRNRAHICSFWVKGECRRGEECPYRHEKPTDPDDPLSEQNLRDRYYGQDDPVASKIMSKYSSMPKLTAPEDRTITTLYIGGIPEELTEADLRDHFYQFGELRSVSVHHKQHCAFLQFTLRDSAERAAERSYDRLILRGHRLTVNWGKSPAALAAANAGISLTGSGEVESLPPVPGLPMPPAPPPPSLIPPTSSTGMLPIFGGFFSAPPPPPPLSTLVKNITSIRPHGTVELAPPVIEPSSADVTSIRAPSSFIPTTDEIPSLPPAAVSAAVLAKLPPPPPPPPALNKTFTLSNDKTKDERTSLEQTNLLGSIAKDLPTLSVHYPSQNPQRLGSVPQTQKHV